MNALELTENHGSSSRGDDDPPFFADMTLDLAEAHDIAETPEATHRKLLATKDQLIAMPKMPVIPQDRVITSSLSNSDDSISPKFNANLSSITHEQTHGRISAMGNNKPLQATRNMPRDIYWAIAFAIFVPFSLLGPIMSSNDAESKTSKTYWLGTSLAPRMATVHSLWWAAIAAFLLSRLLYRTLGGGDGDDARHLASQIVLSSAPISLSIYSSLILTIYFFLPHARIYIILPAWALARDIYIFRQWKMTSSTPGGRQAFFQALTCMTLDILSRSLRRASFYRIVSALLLLQLMVIGLWRMALNAAMHSQSTFWLLLAAVGGKWATGAVARLLTLISSGGISSWFAEQNALVEEMEQMKGGRETENGLSNSSSLHSKSDDEDSEMPEAYRMTAASAYQTTLTPDEGMDDDFEDEDDAEAALNAPISTFLSTPIAGGSTVKQLLLKGVTVNFGSVCKCGLLGGLAQFVWSQLRKIDTARAKLSGFQTMSIGQSNDFQNSKFRHYLMVSNRLARGFVRNNSDMAMSHVAAFQKSYNRAAQDVAILIDESGVEPIIHDDISTHMAACVGGSISGAIVMFTGIILVHQKKSNTTDSAVVMDMVVSFIFCYTLIFTVMEPLRASIKAVYVSFAQHPQSISQSFPLIFHRLSRMAKSNVQ
ncbi:unnamed protein product [Cylindrotheca closterium]|uniref:Choline transporter-like protein n=1 Tax=Cylindrotheca closterium TaxID=2856 RepID=A0AAD2CUE7_9STRA|nr:unnamed protein product [Cylindrotheca closterium]